MNMPAVVNWKYKEGSTYLLSKLNAIRHYKTGCHKFVCKVLKECMLYVTMSIE